MNEETNELTVEQENEIAERRAAAMERLTDIGLRLSRKAEYQVAQRADIEDRWIEDIRQYNGKYEPRTEALLQADKTRSRVFVNITRPKTNSAEARLGDMVLQDDDRNYDISATPVPEVELEVRNAIEAMLAEHEQEMAQPMPGQAPQMPGQAPQMSSAGERVRSEIEKIKEADQLTERMLEEKMAFASRRARMMRDEIDDQLKEANFYTVCRQAIHDCCLLGTGIIKGPVIIGKADQRWVEIVDEMTGESVRVLEHVETRKPSIERVDPWNFFPDSNATRINEAEFVFERSFMTKRQLRNLAKRPGFIRENIARLIEQGPGEFKIDRSHLSRVREASDRTILPDDDNRYELWAYYGPLEKEDLEACGCDVEDIDPLQQIDAVVWFCGAYVIRAEVNPMETEEWPFSVFNWERDDGSIFGYGVPFRLRNPQKVINASWRMTLENAGLATGPQLVVNKQVIQPADGNWQMTAKKVWYLTDRSANVQHAFATFDIAAHQPELMAIFNSARALADEETSLSSVAEGKNATGVYTSGQMQQLMAANNVVIRRVVKEYDDNVTYPTIKRFYDWNMQFSEKEYIKGDYDIIPRGSTTLMVKEIHGQALGAWLQMAGNSPFANALRANSLLKKLARAQHLDADDIIKSDQEMMADAEKQQQAIMSTPEMLRIQMDGEAARYKMDMTYKMNQERLAQKQQEVEARLTIAQINRETEMLKMANDQQVSLEKVKAELAKVSMTLDSQERTQLNKELIKQNGDG